MSNQKVYPDEQILLLRKKLKEKQLIRQQSEDEIIIGMDRVSIVRIRLFHQQDQSTGFSILLPCYLNEMDQIIAAVKYPQLSRPEVILTDKDNDITFLFDRIEMKETEPIEQKLQKIKEMLKKAYPKNIFYDSGTIEDSGVPVPWFEYKGNCINGKYYCLSFGFCLERYFVFGNFQCSFKLYDYWKEAVLKLLGSIIRCSE